MATFSFHPKKYLFFGLLCFLNKATYVSNQVTTSTPIEAKNSAEHFGAYHSSHLPQNRSLVLPDYVKQQVRQAPELVKVESPQQFVSSPPKTTIDNQSVPPTENPQFRNFPQIPRREPAWKSQYPRQYPQAPQPKKLQRSNSNPFYPPYHVYNTKKSQSSSSIGRDHTAPEKLLTDPPNQPQRFHSQPGFQRNHNGYPYPPPYDTNSRYTPPHPTNPQPKPEIPKAILDYLLSQQAKSGLPPALQDYIRRQKTASDPAGRTQPTSSMLNTEGNTGVNANNDVNKLGTDTSAGASLPESPSKVSQNLNSADQTGVEHTTIRPTEVTANSPQDVIAQHEAQSATIEELKASISTLSTPLASADSTNTSDQVSLQFRRLLLKKLIARRLLKLKTIDKTTVNPSEATEMMMSPTAPTVPQTPAQELNPTNPNPQSQTTSSKQTPTEQKNTLPADTAGKHSGSFKDTQSAPKFIGHLPSRPSNETPHQNLGPLQSQYNAETYNNQKSQGYLSGTAHTQNSTASTNYQGNQQRKSASSSAIPEISYVHQNQNSRAPLVERPERHNSIPPTPYQNSGSLQSQYNAKAYNNQQSQGFLHETAKTQNSTASNQGNQQRKSASASAIPEISYVHQQQNQRISLVERPERRNNNPSADPSNGHPQNTNPPKQLNDLKASVPNREPHGPRVHQNLNSADIPPPSIKRPRQESSMRPLDNLTGLPVTEQPPVFGAPNEMQTVEIPPMNNPTAKPGMVRVIYVPGKGGKKGFFRVVHVSAPETKSIQNQPSVPISPIQKYFNQDKLNKLQYPTPEQLRQAIKSDPKIVIRQNQAASQEKPVQDQGAQVQSFGSAGPSASNNNATDLLHLLNTIEPSKVGGKVAPTDIQASHSSTSFTQNSIHIHSQTKTHRQEPKHGIPSNTFGTKAEKHFDPATQHADPQQKYKEIAKTKKIQPGVPEGSAMLDANQRQMDLYYKFLESQKRQIEIITTTSTTIAPTTTTTHLSIRPQNSDKWNNYAAPWKNHPMNQERVPTNSVGTVYESSQQGPQTKGFGHQSSQYYTNQQHGNTVSDPKSYQSGAATGKTASMNYADYYASNRPASTLPKDASSKQEVFRGVNSASQGISQEQMVQQTMMELLERQPHLLHGNNLQDLISKLSQNVSVPIIDNSYLLRKSQAASHPQANNQHAGAVQIDTQPKNQNQPRDITVLETQATGNNPPGQTPDKAVSAPNANISYQGTQVSAGQPAHPPTYPYGQHHANGAFNTHQQIPKTNQGNINTPNHWQRPVYLTTQAPTTIEPTPAYPIPRHKYPMGSQLGAQNIQPTSGYPTHHNGYPSHRHKPSYPPYTEYGYPVPIFEHTALQTTKPETTPSPVSDYYQPQIAINQAQASQEQFDMLGVPQTDPVRKHDKYHQFTDREFQQFMQSQNKLQKHQQPFNHYGPPAIPPKAQPSQQPMGQPQQPSYQYNQQQTNSTHQQQPSQDARHLASSQGAYQKAKQLSQQQHNHQPQPQASQIHQHHQAPNQAAYPPQPKGAHQASGPAAYQPQPKDTHQASGLAAYQPQPKGAHQDSGPAAYQPQPKDTTHQASGLAAYQPQPKDTHQASGPAAYQHTTNFSQHTFGHQQQTQVGQTHQHQQAPYQQPKDAQYKASTHNAYQHVAHNQQQLGGSQSHQHQQSSQFVASGLIPRPPAAFRHNTQNTGLRTEQNHLRSSVVAAKPKQFQIPNSVYPGTVQQHTQAATEQRQQGSQTHPNTKTSSINKTVGLNRAPLADPSAPTGGVPDLTAGLPKDVILSLPGSGIPGQPDQVLGVLDPALITGQNQGFPRDTRYNTNGGHPYQYQVQTPPAPPIPTTAFPTIPPTTLPPVPQHTFPADLMCTMQSDCEAGCCYTLQGEVLWDWKSMMQNPNIPPQVGYCHTKTTTKLGDGCDTAMCPCASPNQVCLSVPPQNFTIPSGYDAAEQGAISFGKCVNTGQQNAAMSKMNQAKMLVDMCMSDPSCPLHSIQLKKKK